MRVRRLDTAQANLTSAIDKINLVISRGGCISAVQTALDAQDYEALADHIAEYQQLEQRQSDLPARGSTENGDVIVSTAREKLLGVVRDQVKDALQAQDSAAAARFIKLYKPLDLPEEGMSAGLTFVRTCVPLPLSSSLMVVNLSTCVPVSAPLGKRSKGNTVAEWASACAVMFLTCLQWNAANSRCPVLKP
jgi:conserved oligomeric Golgi complex subunit 4